MPEMLDSDKRFYDALKFARLHNVFTIDANDFANEYARSSGELSVEQAFLLAGFEYVE